MDAYDPAQPLSRTRRQQLWVRLAIRPAAAGVCFWTAFAGICDAFPAGLPVYLADGTPPPLFPAAASHAPEGGGHCAYFDSGGSLGRHHYRHRSAAVGGDLLPHQQLGPGVEHLSEHLSTTGPGYAAVAELPAPGGAGRHFVPVGPAAGLIHEVESCKEIIDSIMAEAEEGLKRLNSLGL